MRKNLPCLSTVKNYHKLAVTYRASSEHPEMPQVVLLLKMPCDSTSWNTGSQPFMTSCARQVMNRIPGNVTPPWARGWGPLHSCSVSREYTYQHRETDSQQGQPPDRGPHLTQARRPRVPCKICPKYGIISTLTNFLWICITQVECFRHWINQDIWIKIRCHFFLRFWPWRRFTLSDDIYTYIYIYKWFITRTMSNKMVESEEVELLLIFCNLLIWTLQFDHNSHISVL